MYNAEQKERFMRRLSEVYKKRAAVVFNSIEPYEAERELDCSEFNTNEIMIIYKALNLASLDTLASTHTILKKYTNFCLDENMVSDGINHYSELDYNDLNNYINKGNADKKIVSREKVLHIAANMVNPCEQAIVLMAFEGILMNGGYLAAYNIASENIFDGTVELENGKTFPISEELAGFIRASENTYVYMMHDVRGKEMSFDEDDPHAFKRMYNAHGSRYRDDAAAQMYFIRMFKRIREDYGRDGGVLKIKSLNESGRINRIGQLMESDGVSDPAIIMERYKEELSARFGFVASHKRYIVKYNDCFSEA